MRTVFEPVLAGDIPEARDFEGRMTQSQLIGFMRSESDSLGLSGAPVSLTRDLREKLYLFNLRTEGAIRRSMDETAPDFGDTEEVLARNAMGLVVFLDACTPRDYLAEQFAPNYPSRFDLVEVCDAVRTLTATAAIGLHNDALAWMAKPVAEVIRLKVGS